MPSRKVDAADELVDVRLLQRGDVVKVDPVDAEAEVILDSIDIVLHLHNGRTAVFGPGDQVTRMIDIDPTLVALAPLLAQGLPAPRLMAAADVLARDETAHQAVVDLIDGNRPEGVFAQGLVAKLQAGGDVIPEAVVPVVQAAPPEILASATVDAIKAGDVTQQDRQNLQQAITSQDNQAEAAQAKKEKR